MISFAAPGGNYKHYEVCECCGAWASTGEDGEYFYPPVTVSRVRDQEDIDNAHMFHLVHNIILSSNTAGVLEFILINTVREIYAKSGKWPDRDKTGKWPDDLQIDVVRKIADGDENAINKVIRKYYVGIKSKS